MKKLRSASWLRTTVTVASLVMGVLTVVVFIEVGLLSLSARAKAASRDISRLETALRDDRELADWRAAIDRKMKTLNLDEPAAVQGAILVASLKTIADAQHLRILEVRRDAVSAPREGGWPSTDAYEVAVEGSYPEALAALVTLAYAPLVINFKSASFERAATPAEKKRIRASFQLEVFHMRDSDAGSHKP